MCVCHSECKLRLYTDLEVLPVPHSLSEHTPPAGRSSWHQHWAVRPRGLCQKALHAKTSMVTSRSLLRRHHVRKVLPDHPLSVAHVHTHTCTYVHPHTCAHVHTHARAWISRERRGHPASVTPCCPLSAPPWGPVAALAPDGWGALPWQLLPSPRWRAAPGSAVP